jgi:hypothetical protein
VLNGLTKVGGLGPNNLWTVLSSPEAMTRYCKKSIQSQGDVIPIWEDQENQVSRDAEPVVPMSKFVAVAGWGMMI